MRILDLFAGAGGAAMGYHRAFPDAEIVGVDNRPMPRYPFTFVQGDAMTFSLDGYDLIHASPPCQDWSDLKTKHDGHGTGWMLPATIDRLVATGTPWVVENVEGAPLRDPVMLCGTMFSGLRVIRHRLFECSFYTGSARWLPHPRHPLVFTYDKRKAHYGRLDQDTSFVQVTGGGNAKVANKGAAMGIDWMTGAELNEAIPPAYTEYIGAQFAATLERAA